MSQLHDSAGNRKYVSTAERRRFLQVAAKTDTPVRTFCLCLAHTGCRISEALRLTAERIGLTEGSLVFETLKKRHRGQFRRIPVPDEFLDALELAHGIRRLQRGRSRSSLIWSWSRTTAWRRVSME